MDRLKRQRLIETLGSLHWALQQTILITLAMVGYVVGLLNMLDMFAYTAAEDTDPTQTTNYFIKMCLAFIIGLSLNLWYKKRKADYVAAHPREGL